MQQPSVSVVAVIVTRDRLDTLTRSLTALTTQTRPPDRVLVVDNGADTRSGGGYDGAVHDMVTSVPTATYLPSRRNLGGAGGFALGMLHALALGADWVWLADDDGFPLGEDVLERLLHTAHVRGLGMVSPVVVDVADTARLAFPLRRGLSWVRTRRELGDDFVPRLAALFNGALFAASTVERVGVPDLRLFVRGDEVDMHRRVVRSGVAFGTDVSTAYAHPAGQTEWQPILGGRTQVLVPDDGVKRFFSFRNRGFLTAQRGMRRYAGFDLLRYAWFYLVQQRDPASFREWRRLTRAGRREAFHRPD